MAIYAERIKELRERENLTQQGFANVLGVKESTVRMWELGKSHAQTPTLARITERFGVSLDWLYGNGETLEKLLEALNGQKRLALRDPGPSGNAAYNDDDDRRTVMLPVVAELNEGRAGGDYYEEHRNAEPAPRKLLRGDARDHFYLRVSGRNMEPTICEDDLALVRRQAGVDRDGALAVVSVGEERAVLCRVYRSVPPLPSPDDTPYIELRNDNPYFPARRFEGRERDLVRIYGVVLRVVRTVGG